MNKYIIITLLFATNYLSATTLQDTAHLFFKGKINKQYSITLELKVAGTACVGQYYYDKYRQSLHFQGRMEQQQIYLEQLNDQGQKIGVTFEGTYNKLDGQIQGQWKDASKQKNYHLLVQQIRANALEKAPLDFEAVRDFQALLNYFDLKPQLPLQLNTQLKNTKINWQKGNKKQIAADFNRYIPYRLAKRYIMRKVNFVPEGAFNYFNIDKKSYRPMEMSYRSVACLFSTDSYVGLLFNFSDDNGWDSYDVTFLLTFDYNGNLLDGCKVAKQLHLDSSQQTVEETMQSTIQKDYTIVVTSTKKIATFGQQKDGKPFFDKKTIDKHVHYVLQPTGRFFRQEILSK